MAVNPSILGPKPAMFLATGLPAVGYKIYSYVAGSVGQKQDTFTDSTGGAANPNPVVLNVNGQTSNEYWWTQGLGYKLVFAPPTDTDPPSSPIWTIDNVFSIPNTTAAIDQWVQAGMVPTFISTTSFSVPGNQTAVLQVNRRVKTTNTAGTIYSTITASVFAAGITTVTVLNDAGVLDSGLSAFAYGLVSSVNTSLPTIFTEGPWISPPFNAGDFTASGAMTWTVIAGNVQTFAYKITNTTMTMAWRINATTIGGVASQLLLIKIPAGKLPAKDMFTTGFVQNVAGGFVPAFVSVNTGFAQLGFGMPNSAPYTVPSSVVSVAGQITFEIQ